MSWDPSRRVFLKGGLAALGVGMAPTPLLVRAAEAATAANEVLVVVFLRGGADGLNILVPYGDVDYYSIRRELALPRPGQAGGVVDLDGYFGLHPALAPLKPLFSDGRLAFLPAVGNYGLTRSHFDAQDYMETCTPGDKTTTTGWLDRTLARIPGNSVTEGVSFSSQLTRSFLGPEPVLVAQNLTGFDLRAASWRTEAEQLLRAMYDGVQTPVGAMGRDTFASIERILRTPELSAPPANGAAYPAGTAGTALRQAAAVVKSGLGTRCIFVNIGGGFDTHANQLQANVNDYTPLGLALAAFAQDLGVNLDRVLLMVMTEFGRAAYQNGTVGTDHGSAHTQIFLGGRVRGGRVLGRWPGLSRSQLYQERDLAVTTDFRDVFGEVLQKHLGIGDVRGVLGGYAPGAGPGVL